MTKEARPGMRILLETGGTIRHGTMSAVLQDAASKWWGLTAGHVVDGFSAGDTVWYFPDDQQTELGKYAPPVAKAPLGDLGKFAVELSDVMLAPVGFSRDPAVWPADKLKELVNEKVTFLGGQVGTVAGKVLRIDAYEAHPEAIFVRLKCKALITGDSGGPLYFDDGDGLFWIGTLSEGEPLSSEAEAIEAVFLHPARAFPQLGLPPQESLT